MSESDLTDSIRTDRPMIFKARFEDGCGLFQWRVTARSRPSPLPQSSQLRGGFREKPAAQAMRATRPRQLDL